MVPPFQLPPPGARLRVPQRTFHWPGASGLRPEVLVNVIHEMMTRVIAFTLLTKPEHVPRERITVFNDNTCKKNSSSACAWGDSPRMLGRSMKDVDTDRIPTKSAFSVMADGFSSRLIP